MDSSKRYFLKRSFKLGGKDILPIIRAGLMVLFSIAVFSLPLSCATKRIEIHYYEGSLDDRLRDLEDIKSIKAVFSIEFDRGDGITINGEGILNLSEDDLDLQVYSMGFLVAEVNADRTGLRSNPSVNKNRLVMLVDGLRNSFFWWSIKGYDIKDRGENLIMGNSWKRVTIDKKTMMPSSQIIELEDGRQLEIFYYEPSDVKGFVFPLRIRMELSKYAVNLRIKDISVIR